MTRGRPIRPETKLARLILQRKIHAYEVAAYCKFSPRLLTEYVAGRRVIRNDHLLKLMQLFGCNDTDLLEDDLHENLTNAVGKPLKKTGAKTVAELDIPGRPVTAMVKNGLPTKAALPPVPKLLRKKVAS